MKMYCQCYRFIGQYNNFSFNGIHYRQLSGTAMGTRMAPSFANLFMSRLETNILSQASVLPLCWWRYIDDIFILWDKSAEDLQDFFEHCNNYHPTIKFTTSVSDSAVNFLDVTVKISEGKISTDLYTKPTDKHLYLLPSSCHPRHCTRSIPKSQALRLRRICSDDATFETRSSELSEHLTKRGYKKPIIKRVIEETRKINRNDTLRYKNKDKPNTRTPLVVTYHPDLPPLAQIVNKHFSILQTNDKLKQVFPEPPLISYRRPKNLRDLIVRAKLPSDAPEETNVIGSHPCQSSRCKNCKNMTQTNAFTSNTTKQTFKIRENITCTTINVIYLIECTFCGIQYVGETSKKIQDRMRGHRSDIKCKRTDANHPVAIHFNQPGHTLEHFKVTGIEHCLNKPDSHRLNRENYWQHQLRTFTPLGLNIKNQLPRKF